MVLRNDLPTTAVCRDGIQSPEVLAHSTDVQTRMGTTGKSLDSRAPLPPRPNRGILIADDDAIFRTVASELVRSWGYDCTEVVDGEAALEILTQAQPPTIAIVDWLMPKITGTEICRRIRSGGAARYIFFILVSAREGRDDSIEGLRSGADSYVSKPLDAEELRAKLEIANRILLMEESLRDFHAETELFINSVPSVLIGTDIEGKITRWNNGAEAVFDINKKNAEGRSLSSLGIWGNGVDVLRRIEKVLSTGSSRQLNLAFVRNEEQRLAGLTVHPLRSHVGTIVGSVIIGSDITEKKVIEDQLRQTQKLEAIGQLAAGIAHEINTPTQFVSDNLTFLKGAWTDIAPLLAAAQKLKASGATAFTGADLAEFEAVVGQLDLDYVLKEIPQAINDSLDGLGRTSKIVRAMKEFSHRGSGEKQDNDINAAILTTITVCRNEWRYVADVDTDLAPDLPHVPCVVDQFNQVVLNIIVNAAHAIADVVKDGAQGKGHITVRTRREGDWAEIAISDTGAGIPLKIRNRVFEPFFSTKEVGKGTGQGLAMAHNAIVKIHGGKIWFDSVPDKGTTFFIRLPLSPSSVPQESPSTESSTVVGPALSK